MSTLKQFAYFSCIFAFGAIAARADGGTYCVTNQQYYGNCIAPFSPTLPTPVVTYTLQGNELIASANSEVHISPHNDSNIYQEYANFSDYIVVDTAKPGDTLQFTGGVSATGTGDIEIQVIGTNTYFGQFDAHGGNNLSNIGFTIPAKDFNTLSARGNLFAGDDIAGEPQNAAGSVSADIIIKRFLADGSPDDFTPITPEPATWGFMLLAGIGLIGYRRNVQSMDDK